MTMTCGIMLSSSCQFDKHIIMLSSSCEFDRHIDMLSSSCELHRHIDMPSSSYHHLVMLSSSCEFDSPRRSPMTHTGWWLLPKLFNGELSKSSNPILEKCFIRNPHFIACSSLQSRFNKGYMQLRNVRCLTWMVMLPPGSFQNVHRTFIHPKRRFGM